MAKFLPFVSKDAPINEVAEKICSKYPGLTGSNKLQLLNIVFSEGIEKVENAIKNANEKTDNPERFVIREFSHVNPIPFYTLSIAEYYIRYLEEWCPLSGYSPSDFRTTEAVILCLALSFHSTGVLCPLYNKSLPVIFREEAYLTDLINRGLFSSSDTAETRQFDCPESLKAFILFQYVHPVAFIELDPEKPAKFIKPVRAILRE